MPSNKKMIKLALNMVSLSGEVNKKEREEVVKVIDSTNYLNYVILFKGHLGRTDYRALYQNDGADGHIVKIHGAASAPEKISGDMVQSFFKYNSGRLEFMSLGQKDFTTTTDGISMKKEF